MNFIIKYSTVLLLLAAPAVLVAQAAGPDDSGEERNGEQSALPVQPAEEDDEKGLPRFRFGPIFGLGLGVATGQRPVALPLPDETGAASTFYLGFNFSIRLVDRLEINLRPNYGGTAFNTFFFANYDVLVYKLRVPIGFTYFFNDSFALMGGFIYGHEQEAAIRVANAVGSTPDTFFLNTGDLSDSAHGFYGGIAFGNRKGKDSVFYEIMFQYEEDLLGFNYMGVVFDANVNVNF